MGKIRPGSIKECKHQQIEQISLDYNLGFRKENGLDFIKRFIAEGYYVMHINLHSAYLWKMKKSLIIEEKIQNTKIIKSISVVKNIMN
ncbi:cyclic-phosphate processing receiver domain-containing protein [Gottfriedia acidiceleris]|uniref:cyclic-phosphate processing receiver domain-containing protein n=1 Tax=Gottfriedia acidiceleris TaxID=371036 RepID=UPI003AF33028